MPTESEKDGAPTLTLSRLQLLGVGLTLQHTETSQVTQQVMESQTKKSAFEMDDVITGNWWVACSVEEVVL